MTSANDAIYPDPARSWTRFRGDLERHFNPRLSLPDAADRLEARRIQSAAAHATLSADLDLHYGPGPRQTLDLFHPVGMPVGTVMVFIHGGYWRGGDKNDASLVATPFVAKGIPTFIVNYDLCPDVTLAQIVVEIGEALAWIAEYSRGRGYGSRLFLFGHSAGAHLAAMVLAERDPEHDIIGAALASGIYDLAPVPDISVNAELGLTQDDIGLLSPLLKQPPACPVLLSIGGQEPEGWRAQTLDYHRLCRDAAIPVELFDYPEENHMSLLNRHAAGDCPMRARMMAVMGVG